MNMKYYQDEQSKEIEKGGAGGMYEEQKCIQGFSRET